MTNPRRVSGRVGRRASAIGASLLMTLAGLVATAPTAPAAPGAAGAAAPSTQAVAVTVGKNHSCALTAAGGVRCWGDNYYGQLGDGTRADRHRPVDVVGLTSGVAQLSSSPQGNTTCVVTTVGGVKCWGDGAGGELGTGDSRWSSVPVDVVGLTAGVASVSVGGRVVCALTITGGAKCWGLPSYLGGGGTSPYGPVDVTGMGSGVRAVSASILGGCVLTANGASCWGYNSYGTLGNGDTTGWNQYEPVRVLRLGSDVTSIDGGSAGKCATTAGGRLFCWGNNASGLLGVGSSDPRVATPLPVRGLTGITAVSEGDLVTCALQAHRTWCWGNNRDGAVGDGTTTDRTSPVQVVGLPGRTVGIAAGAFHTCAVSSLGRVSCWGANDGGQLGNGSATSSPVPVRVAGFAAG